MSSRFQWRTILDTAAMFGVLVASALVIYSYWPRSASRSLREPPLPAEPVSIQTAITVGSRAARVALIEYSEFQCPFCAKYFRDTEPTIKKQYVETGKVLLAFRHFPLETIHPFARSAAEGAECAARQNRFAEMRNFLFTNQKQLGSNTATDYALDVGLDPGLFHACLKEDAVARVNQDVHDGIALGVSSTPTFFVGLVEADGRVKVSSRIKGAKPFEQFQVALDRLLGYRQ